MVHKAPGKAYREGITLLQLADLFPTEESAVGWFEGVVWSGERACGHCGSLDTYGIKSGKPMPYRCRDCKRYFSVKTGTLMASSPLPVRKWVYAIYLDVTSLKGVGVDEAAPRPRRHTEDRLVHAATHQGSLPGRRADGLRGAGRSVRDLFRRPREEQACVQEAEGWPWSGSARLRLWARRIGPQIK